MFNIFDGLDKLGFAKTPKSDSIFTSKLEHEVQANKMEAISTEDDFSSYVFIKKRICPVCDKTFSDMVLRSKKCRYLNSDSDLRARYLPLDPIYYDVVLCHFCGYAAMNSHFDQATEKQVDLILNNIKSQYQYKEYPVLLTPSDATERYQLALLCATIKNARSSEKAMLCLRLAWLSRDKKELRREREFYNLALKGFEMAYENETFPLFGMEPITLYYLMGELYRRVGRRDEALRYIGRVIVSKSASERLKERARNVRDMMKII